MASTGDRIREIRDKRGISQDRLAKEADLSKGFLSDVENSKANISSQNLLRIADFLEVSIDYLMRGENHESSTPKAVVIPPELSQAAQQLSLSYTDTVELLEAYSSVVARRSSKATKIFSIEDWKKLHLAIKKVFG